MPIKLITLVTSQVWDYKKEVEIDFQCIYSVLLWCYKQIYVTKKYFEKKLLRIYLKMLPELETTRVYFLKLSPKVKIQLNSSSY